MGKVLNAMKKSAGTRKAPTTPATPATPATPNTDAAAKPASLDAVTTAVQQATELAVEKLTGRNNTAAQPAAQAAVATEAPPAPQKGAVGTPRPKAADAVVQAVAAGQTVIRPQKTFKTSITPSVEDMVTKAPRSAPPKSSAAPAAASNKPVSRAINRADVLASVRARRGPVASRESHYFSPLVVTYNQPRCQISEQFRHIRTALMRLANRGPVRCMITSSQPREGKTVTAVNLAYCFSEVTKKRTLLIDADLRRGRVSELLGMGRKNGLSELLNGECSIEDATWSAGRSNFHVITSGSGSIEQIGEMLSGDQAEQVMTNLTRMYDNIIIDSPPVISVADPAILCRWVDMALMAVRIHSTHCNLIEQATQILEGVGVHVTGLIALDEKASQRNYYRYVNYG